MKINGNTNQAKQTAAKFGTLHPPTAAVVSLSAMAWLLLIYWSNSSFQHTLSHADWRQAQTMHTHEGMTSTLLVGGSGWVLMIVAMMFPAMIPAIRRTVMTARLNALIMGYLCAWLLFGVVAHMAGMLVQYAVGVSALLDNNGWLVSVAVLVLAGVYQLTENKSRCLQRCEVYCVDDCRKRPELYGAWFARGWQYGVNCIGCCWAVMLLMFVAWPGSVLWMFVLSVLMAAERFLPLEVARVPLSLLYLISAAALFVAHMV